MWIFSKIDQAIWAVELTHTQRQTHSQTHTQTYRHSRLDSNYAVRMTEYKKLIDLLIILVLFFKMFPITAFFVGDPAHTKIIIWLQTSCLKFLSRYAYFLTSSIFVQFSLYSEILFFSVDLCHCPKKTIKSKNRLWSGRKEKKKMPFIFASLLLYR